jgi:L-arabinose isomerase
MNVNTVPMLTMDSIKTNEVWFLTGSQHLYGEETLRQVENHSKEIVDGLSESEDIPVRIIFQPVLTTPEAILRICRDANNNGNCIGLIAWMHTFSPSKMWIAGLNELSKPLLHFHTQYNRDIPWDSIDMDFMNLNQSAHGDREFGYICTRMKKVRKVVVGHWKDTDVQQKLAVWIRAAMARRDMQGAKIARFGDNMREVAVTEGDKVEAQMRFGYSVNGYGVGELVNHIQAVSDNKTEQLLQEYEEKYEVAESLKAGEAKRQSLKEAARIELGLRSFLEEGGFKGFTTTFEDLHGLAQLPGLSVQRLMADGYGFGAEGDWKTAALVRAMKVMAHGLKGGTSFMEDYTYHLDSKDGGMKVLGAHMLEICESIASQKPYLDIAPLSIGGKADPPRLIFTAPPGPAVNASIIDMGNRFRLVVNEVDTVAPDKPLPRLPVARALWIPKPNLELSAGAWILAGGAHHTCFSQALTSDHLDDFAEMSGIEFLLIDDQTKMSGFKKELRSNEVFFNR